MSLETDLYTVLSAICPNVYPDTAPDNPPRPYITWQQVGGFQISPIANEVADKRNAFIQINVWANTRIEARDLALQIEHAIVVSPLFIGRPQGAFVATMEDDLDLRGTVQDFSIWASR